MPQLDPTWFASQLFWLVVIFGALYVTLSRWALPRLLGVLALRQETLSGDLNRAQGLTKDAERAREDYERTLAQARSRAQGLIADAMLAHKAKADQASKAMDAQVAAQLSDAERKIAVKKADLMQSLSPAAAELANLIVEKLTRSRPGEDMQAVVLDMARWRR